MKFLILFLFPATVIAGDMCFFSHHDAANYADRWEKRAQAMRVKTKTKITADRCTHCIQFEGDGTVRAMMVEDFAKKEPAIRKPGNVEIKNLPVEVSIGGLMPWEKVNNVKVRDNHHYVPFIRFPDMTSNTLYITDDKTPIEVNAKMLHPELVQFEFKMKDQKFTYSAGMNEQVTCLFPDMKEMPKMFVKENDRFLELKTFGMKPFRKDRP